METLQREVAQHCTQALLDEDAAFFKRLATAMRNPPGNIAKLPTDYKIRLILQHEAKAGPVNLSQFRARLRKFTGIRIDIRTLRRIAKKLEVPVVRSGRPRKSGT